MRCKISAPSAYGTGIILGLPAFLAAAKAFIWLMSTIGTVS